MSISNHFLISKFEFPIACLDFSINPSRNKLAAVGTYQPSVKIYDLDSMNLKLERHSVNELIKVQFLDDFKFACLRSGNSIEFHTKNGLHDVVKLPKAGRDFCFQNRILYISADKIYRFDLEQGRFVPSFDQNLAKNGFSNLFNKLTISNTHGILAYTNDSSYGFVDSRSNDSIFHIDFDCDVHCIDVNNTLYSIGTENGYFEYDFRNFDKFIKNDFSGEKIHQFKYSGKSKICCSGSGFYIDSEFQDVGYVINAFQIDGGVVFTGGENSTMHTFYCSKLGEAPMWCKNISIN